MSFLFYFNSSTLRWMVSAFMPLVKILQSISVCCDITLSILNQSQWRYSVSHSVSLYHWPVMMLLFKLAMPFLTLTFCIILLEVKLYNSVFSDDLTAFSLINQIKQSQAGGNVSTGPLLRESQLNLSLPSDLCGSGMRNDASISKGALVSWGLFSFPSQEGTQPNGGSYIYKHESMEWMETLRDLWGFLPYLISPWFIFPSHTSTYISYKVGKLHDYFPSSLFSSNWVLLKGASHKVWHHCDGFICDWRTSIVMKWVTNTKERGRRSRHLIRRVWVWNIYWSEVPCLCLQTWEQWRLSVIWKIYKRLFIERLPGQVNAFTTRLRRSRGSSEC